jgi:hypothetical protein
MNDRELEERLESARAAVRQAQAALAGRHKGNEWDDFHRSLQAQLAAERALSLAREEPTCLPLPWQPLWSAGAPCPHVVSSGHRTLLIYLVAQHDPSWDGTTARMINPAAGEKERLALVEFKRCYGHRFGGPNDEVWHGHPLHGHGLEAYRPHLVENSPWVAAERKTNSVHRGFRPEAWEGRRHYLLLFHDNLFECIAEVTRSR